MNISCYTVARENGSYSVTAKYEKTLSVSVDSMGTGTHKDEARELAGRGLVDENRKDLCEAIKAMR